MARQRKVEARAFVRNKTTPQGLFFFLGVIHGFTRASGLEVFQNPAVSSRIGPGGDRNPARSGTGGSGGI